MKGSNESQWHPLNFVRETAILRWHDRGRVWDRADMRIDSFVAGMGRMRPTVVRVLHLPTGAFAEGVGTKDQVVAVLHASVCKAADELVRFRAAGMN